MKERKHYFSLRCKGGNAWHENGTSIKLTAKAVNIGETADCDVRFDADGYEPDYYATILQNEDGKSWRIVRRSQYAEISVEGHGPIGIAHQLKDGDILHFGAQQMGLQFNEHYDNRYDTDERKKRVWPWIAVAAVFLVGIAFFLNNMRADDSISMNDVAPLEESIYLIKVESVEQVKIVNGRDTIVCNTKKLTDNAPIGTAFLTTDGRLVTARHCVEYWIGYNLDLTTKVDDMDDDDIVRWAIDTESFNHGNEEDTVKMMRVHFSVYDFMGEKRSSFCSTDSCVHINREHDGVFMLADFNNEYYWRTVRPYFEDREMELGDILWISGIEGTGKIETLDDIKTNNIKRGTRIIICGFPMTGNGDKRAVFAEGTIMQDIDDSNKNIVFEGNINHGFSGGPLLMKTSDGIKAIGIVSRVDSVSSGIFKWAVPITEIGLKKGGEK